MLFDLYIVFMTTRMSVKNAPLVQQGLTFSKQINITRTFIYLFFFRRATSVTCRFSLQGADRFAASFSPQGGEVLTEFYRFSYQNRIPLFLGLFSFHNRIYTPRLTWSTLLSSVNLNKNQQLDRSSIIRCYIISFVSFFSVKR